MSTLIYRRVHRLVAFALVAMLALGAFGAFVSPVLANLGDPTYTEDWDGRGTDSEKCEEADGELRDGEAGWIHWVFNTKGGSEDARLILGETGSGTYEPGPPLNANVWHFYTPFFDLDGLTATINLYGGDPGSGRC